MDFPIIEIRRFNVCQDLANLNTRNLTHKIDKEKAFKMTYQSK